MNIQEMIERFKINNQISIEFLHSGKIIYGRVVGHDLDHSLLVDRVGLGIGRVPVNNPNVVIKNI